MIKGIASIKPGVEECCLLQTDKARGIQQSHSALNYALHTFAFSFVCNPILSPGFSAYAWQVCFKVYAHFHRQGKSDKQLYMCGTIKQLLFILQTHLDPKYPVCSHSQLVRYQPFFHSPLFLIQMHKMYPWDSGRDTQGFHVPAIQSCLPQFQMT